MPDVFGVATYILHKLGTAPEMRLHKLLYYCQAWSLVWDDAPLFDNRIEAWAHGPAIPDLYDALGNRHCGFIEAKHICGGKGEFTSAQVETIDSVLEFYGDRDADWLMNLCMGEEPWRAARKNIPAWERGHVEITQEAMRQYYSSL